MAVSSKPKVGRPTNAERAARAAAANSAGPNDGLGEQINGNDSIDPAAIGGSQPDTGTGSAAEATQAAPVAREKARRWI
jgi:hypothetical protein